MSLLASASARCAIAVALLLGVSCSEEVSEEVAEFTPDPIACPEGAEPKLMRFSDMRVENRQPLSHVGWRCFRADGKRHGPSKEWFENGQVSAVTNWDADEKHGPFEMWHPNGQKKAQGEHDHWKAVGVWTSWDEQGTVLTTKDFGRPGAESAAPNGEAAPEGTEPAGESPRAPAGDAEAPAAGEGPAASES